MAEVIRFIGIDFGTSTSVVSYLDYEKEKETLISRNNLTAVDFANGENITAIPTIVWEEGNKFGCEIGEETIEKYPDQIKREFKMQLGSDVSADERNKAINLMNKFMKYLADTYINFEIARGNKVAERRIFISYPAKWELQQKNFTKNAAREAFKNYGEVYDYDEPTAVLYYSLHSENTNKQVKEELSIVGKASNILIVDMGAGTTDLVLYKYQPNTSTKILAKFPEPGKDSITFGGREVDQYLKSYLKEKHSSQVTGEKDNFILSESKKWKEQFSKSLYKDRNDFRERLPFRIIDNFNINKICLLLKDYLPEFPKLINGIIEEAKANHADFSGSKDIDFIILTGGHSQWFFVEDMLRGIWNPGLPGNENVGSGINLDKIKNQNWRLIRTPEPQHIVSYGLCLSGNPIDLIYLSNYSVRMEITIGEGYPEYIDVIKKNERLPYTFSKSIVLNSKIKREDNEIPIKIVPIIGSKGDRLDPIFLKLSTNGFTTLANVAVDGIRWFMRTEAKKHRRDEVSFTLKADFDTSMIMSLSGSTSTEWFIAGESKNFSLNATAIAQIVKDSMNK